MLTARAICRSTPFPAITGFEQHSFAYDNLRKRWENFSGEVRDEKHFMLFFQVIQVNTGEKWNLCAEYFAGCCREDGQLGRVELKWLRPEDMDTNLTPYLG